MVNLTHKGTQIAQQMVSPLAQLERNSESDTASQVLSGSAGKQWTHFT